MIGRILVVDDDPSICETFRHQLGRGGHEISTAADAEEALSRLAEIDPDLVITDLRMPGMDGLELLQRVRESAPGVDVLVITAHEDMQSAAGAMKSGAVDYLVKPLDLDQIELVIERCLESRKIRRQASRLASEAAEPYASDQLVGRDPRMIEVFKMVGTLAASRTTALIRGETGTGKERIARAIHYTSDASAEPFVAVNCTTLTDTLLESELFGHVRGAFTGATGVHRGFFEMAGTGTVFLDEIGDTSPALQSKLLRILDDREFYPVGGERPLRTEARILAATHQPLERKVETGEFREDLYYRLRVVEVVVPPLRERPGDIPLLTRHLLERIAKKLHANVPAISHGALEALSAYKWPGNVRELENALTRAAVLAPGGTILEQHLLLGGPPTHGEPVRPIEDTLAAAEAAHAARILEREGWNKRRTARILGISRSRLDRLIVRHGLTPPGRHPGS